MDIELRREVREEKIEVRDRLDRLEERITALEAAQIAPPVATSTSKKSASDAAQAEKDAG